MTLHMNESNNIELQKSVREIEERLHRVEVKLWPEVAGSGTERYDGSGTDRYGFTEYTSQSAFTPVPTQAEADAAAAKAKEEEEYNETVYYEDGSSAYGPKPLPRVNEHGSPAKV